MRKIFLLILLHVVVLGGIWWWRHTEPDAFPVHDPVRLQIQNERMIDAGEIFIKESSSSISIKGPTSMTIWMYVSATEISGLTQNRDLQLRLNAFNNDLFQALVKEIHPEPERREDGVYYLILMEISPEEKTPSSTETFAPLCDKSKNQNRTGFPPDKFFENN